MRKKFTLLIAALALLTMIVQPLKAVGQDTPEVTLSFTSNTWGLPVGSANGLTASTSYTDSETGYSVTLYATTKYYFNSDGYLMLGKTNSTLTLPAFSFDVEKIEVVGRSGASGTVGQNIYVGNTAVSTATSGAQGTNTYEISNGYQTAGNVFVLKVTTNANTQITSIKIYKKAGGSSNTPSFTANDVNIDYDATGGQVAYTLDAQGTTGTVTATVPSGSWITLPQSFASPIAFTCSENPSYLARTETVTLTYTYTGGDPVNKPVTVTQGSNPTGEGSATDPLTVAEARTLIDGLPANTSSSTVYATGIVKEIPYAYTANNGITFNMVDNSGDTEFLQAYKCQGDEAPNVAIGDIVVVSGNLTKYGQTYEFGTGCQVVSLTHPAVETPTFSPAAGTYASAQTVSIACETAGTTIYYTTNGDVPTSASTQYSAAIPVSTTTTIKAIAIKGSDESPVATATYHINSQTNPYTVAQALAFHEYPTSTIYVHGIVSTAPTQAPTNNGELTYYISDNGEATNQLEVYKGKGLDDEAFTAQDDIQLGDIVTIVGVIKDYQGTIEFQQGNYLVEFERPAAPSINVTPATITVEAAGGYPEFAVSFENLTITDEGDFDVEFFDSDGTTVASQPSWITDYVFDYDATEGYGLLVEVDENTGEQRVAYFKVWALDDVTPVYSNLITITQSQPVTPVINAENVNIAYSATSGAIEYTITNGTGSVTASVTTGNWLTLGTITASEVPFTCSANDGDARTATVTLSFTDAADKVVTVTQAAYSASYSGTGTFTKVTTLADLEDGGYYVLYGVNGSYTGAMNSTLSSGKMGLTAVTFTGGNIIDPDESIVWKLEAKIVGEDTYWNLFNEDANKYCYIGSDNTSGFAMGDDPGDNYYSVDVDEENFSFVGQYGNRMISIYQSDFRCYASSNAKTLYLYKLGTPSTDPVLAVSPYQTNLTSDATNGTLAVTATNFSLGDATVPEIPCPIYNSNWDNILIPGEDPDYPSWLDLAYTYNNANGQGTISYSVTANESTEPREAHFKLRLKIGSEDIYSDQITITQAAPAVTYTLATSIESGRHYIIFASTSNVTRAAGAQNGDIRNAEDVTVESNGKVSVSSDNVYEFVINGPDTAGYYTIYDPRTGGFMAAGNKKFKAQSTPENWNIVFDEGNATISPATGSYTGYSVQYNAQSPRFACYDSNQTAISLYVKDETAPTYDFYKYIAGYNGGDGGYYLVTSPVAANPENVTGMVTGTFDLYAFDQAQDLEWRNYEAESFNLVAGQGYLYANNANVTLHFNGTPAEVATVNLSKATTGSWKGWNLVGNPFGQVAYITKDYYRMNEDGDDFIAGVGGIDLMEGVFVVANTNGETLTFSKSAPAGAHGNNGGIAINLSQTANTRNGIQNHLIDRAIVRFGEGDVLPKFMLNSDNTRLYIPQGDNDYAVVRSEAQGEMPVNFKAAENGTYTISVEAENLDVEYLHLIDNMTGANVDLLATPSYTFEARKSDYASRFRLVFNANAGNSEVDDDFAFVSDGNIVISNEGEATLQVIDMLGRVVSTQSVNGSASIENVGVAGVYVLRLVNGNNVKTQRIVVR